MSGDEGRVLVFSDRRSSISGKDGRDEEGTVASMSGSTCESVTLVGGVVSMIPSSSLSSYVGLSWAKV